MPIRAVPVDFVAQRRHVSHGRLQLGRDPPAPLHDGQALLGQLSAVAVNELNPELALEPGHVAGDVGLDRVQGGGGGRKAAVVSDGDERLKLPEVHHLYRYHRLLKRFDRSLRRAAPGPSDP